MTLSVPSDDNREGYRVEPDVVARYRFETSHLKFLNTFATVVRRPGWILPAAGKVLVNVVRTDDCDVWRSEVEGSDERGTVICTFSTQRSCQ
jgi:hypothetical protein